MSTSHLSDAAYRLGLEDILKRRAQEDSEMTKTVLVKLPAYKDWGGKVIPAREFYVVVEVDMDGIAHKYGQRAIANKNKRATVCHGLVKVTAT
jgi:hypothetical protein